VDRIDPPSNQIGIIGKERRHVPSSLNSVSTDPRPVIDFATIAEVPANSCRRT
jgi:hypothetical protein